MRYAALLVFPLAGCLPGPSGDQVGDAAPDGAADARASDGGASDGGAGDAGGALCENGVRDPGEICDGDDLGGMSCDILGLGGGMLTCAPGCQRFDNSGCEQRTEPPPAGCGDDRADGDEVCDGEDLREATCETLGLDPGTLRCGGDCRRYDPAGCGGGACEPACGARICGSDPVCGSSCGVCPEGACNADGECEVEANPSAPRFLQFGTNVAVLHEGDTVVFSAVLTDADGIDDLIGGTLLDARTGATLGPFTTAAQEGAYGLHLTWDELHTSAPINVGPAGEPRTYRAEFFDQGGLSAQAETSLRLQCGEAGQSACDGACFDLQTDLQNCGRCGHAVERQGGAAITCRGGAPACVEDDPLYILCDERCVDSRFDDQNCGACGKVCDRSDTDLRDCRAAELGGCLGEFITRVRAQCVNVCAQAVPGGACPPYEDVGRAYFGPGNVDFDDVRCDEVPAAEHRGHAFTELHCLRLS